MLSLPEVLGKRFSHRTGLDVLSRAEFDERDVQRVRSDIEWLVNFARTHNSPTEVANRPISRDADPHRHTRRWWTASSGARSMAPTT